MGATKTRRIPRDCWDLGREINHRSARGERKIASTFDRDVVLARKLGLLHDRLEPGRPTRLLGLRAEMPMPDEARDGHTPTRSGW